MTRRVNAASKDIAISTASHTGVTAMIFFDLETSGLVHNHHEVIQLAAVVVNDRLEEIETFEAKLQFDISSADPKSLEMNSYDPHVWVTEARPAEHVYWEFAELLCRHMGERCILAGHNAARFDVPFIQEMFARQGIALPGNIDVVCTYRMARELFRGCTDGPANYRLGTLCEWFGVPLENAHDALADVRATIGIWKAMLDPNPQCVLIDRCLSKNATKQCEPQK